MQKQQQQTVENNGVKALCPQEVRITALLLTLHVLCAIHFIQEKLDLKCNVDIE